MRVHLSHSAFLPAECRASASASAGEITVCVLPLTLVPVSHKLAFICDDPSKAAGVAKNHHQVVDLSDRALQQIVVLEKESGRSWWNTLVLELNLLRGISNLAMLDARSQAEAAFRAVLKLNPEHTTALTGTRNPLLMLLIGYCWQCFAEYIQYFAAYIMGCDACKFSLTSRRH